MTKSKTSVSKIFVWILLGFLFVGLIGFGTGNLSGNIKTIGKIGDTEITVNQYVRALQSELRNTSQQFGQQQNQRRQETNYKEGETVIDKKPTNSDKNSSEKVGEYIEYEEID